MSDTPETDAQVTTFISISKLKKRFEVSTGKVSAEFARKLERERDEARAALSQIAEDCRAWLDSENDEPSAVFVKLVGQYAYDASRKEAVK